MLLNLELNKFKFKVAIADTEEKQYKGLSNLEKLGNNKGLLFIFTEPKKIKMVMRDMKFNLDFIFLDENWRIIQLDSLDKNDKFGIESRSNTMMVLEVSKGTIKKADLKLNMKLTPEKDLIVQKEGIIKFKHGGSFQQIGDVIYSVKEDDIKIEKDKLQILNGDGEVVANIRPNSRIFSREHTKEIVTTIKNKSDKEVGELVVKIIDIHNNQSPDYVKS